MPKLRNIQFSFRPQDSSIPKDILRDLINNQEFVSFCKQFIGKSPIRLKAEEKPEKDSKADMYEFYHKVVLDVAVMMYTEHGWVGVDKATADYMLKEQLSQFQVYNEHTGKVVTVTEDKADMSYSRLHEYICSVINFLEIENGYKVPDSVEFKNPGFKKV